MELLERTSQLRALNSALDQARTGRGSVVLVHGEAGIGKTSLVGRFAKEHEDSWRILMGACDSLFTPRPLSPLYDIAPLTSGNLSTLLDSESSRPAIFPAFLNQLKEEATILVIEDIHWADEATLDLLKYLGRRFIQTGSLMLLTYRDDELGMDHPLRLLLGDLAASSAVLHIAVPSLSKEAIGKLAAHKKVDPIALHAITNGNPFFVTEVLAVETGIPETVRDAVLARAARLSPSARGVLEAAAVIGSRVETWLLSIIVGADAAYVEECIAGGMLLSYGDYCAFRHELARQTILESISLQRKIALHRQTLDALKESPVTRENLARLAHHAQAVNDPQAVLEYAPLAAWWASELGAHREAAAHYKTALQYSKLMSAEEHAELLDTYSMECDLTDQRLEAKRAQEEALHLWRELGRREKEGRALRRLSEIDHHVWGSLEREKNILDAITILESVPPSRELAMAYSHMSRVHMSLNRASGKDPMYWSKRAMELAVPLGDAETLAHALNSMGSEAMHTGRLVEGQAKLEESLRLSLAHGFQFQAARAYFNLANELRYSRDYAAGLRYANEGIEFCTQNDLDNWHSALLFTRSLIRFEQGIWADAHEDIESSLKFRHGNALFEDPESELLLVRLQARRGEPFSSETVTSLRELATRINDLDTKCEFAAFFAELAWLSDDMVQCRAEAEPTFQMVSQLYTPPYISMEFGELSLWMWRAGAILQPPPNVGEPFATQISGEWKEAAKIWEEYGCPYDQAMALWDGDQTAQLAALEIFERLGAHPAMQLLRQKMYAQGTRVPRGPRPATRENPFGLTVREMELLAQLAGGLSNSSIAKKLSLSTRTVEHHIASILQKMQVQSRAEAVARALKDHLLSSE